MKQTHPRISGSSEELPTPRARRVLVVDDERDTVNSLVAVLRHEGYDARGAYDGAGALEEFENFNADVLIVDIAMPEMSGWDLAREILANRETKPLLIAISGTYVKAPDRMLCRIAGFSHFLVKPCDPRVLFPLIGPATTFTRNST